MKKMKCRICNQENKTCFSGKILNKYNIEYFHCEKCSFLQTEEPHWLTEAYAESINVSDTGYMHRNIIQTNRVTILLHSLFNNQGKYLDYSGGYGVFVRLMRDIGFDFYWDDRYTKNIFAKGFEWDKAVKIEAITSFESFEHFVNPMLEIESLLKISKTIIFATNTYPQPIPKPKDWWYYGLEHGQHISFYSEQTFNHIAKKFNISYYNLGSFHILTDKNISKWQKIAIRLNKFKYQSIAKKMKSKTWDDHLKMSKIT